MKKIFFMFSAVVTLLLIGCGNSGNGRMSSSNEIAQDTGTVKIIFSEYDHGFGQVGEGEKVSCVFDFTVSGTKKLVIASATASCGCTIPEFDKKPIPPGGSGKIRVVFNTSGRRGMQTKIINVKSNAEPPVTLLRISADVIPRQN